MDFTNASIPASKQYLATDIIEMSAGHKFQIRNNETGDIVYDLDEVVPAGKKWQIHVHVSVIETDE